jgi:hypothetical protein
MNRKVVGLEQQQLELFSVTCTNVLNERVTMLVAAEDDDAETACGTRASFLVI